MSDNVKHLTLKGLFWNAIDRFGFQAVVTLVGIMVARILPVGDFAVIAVLTIFSTIATSFVDSGLATSLVRSKIVDEIDYSSMFVFNLLVSFTLYLVLFFSAPWIENFYGIKDLALYARVLFLQLLIHALGIVQYVKVLKKMQFDITARVNLLSVAISGAMAIILALLDFGAWVLVLQPVIYSTFRTLLFWFWGDWKIDFSVSRASLKKHFEFSLSFMAANMMGKILSPLYNSIIGKHFTSMQIGYYYQANKWGETPNLLISSIIQGTTLSSLTPIQDDHPRFLNACRKTMSTLAFVLFPISFLIISIAKPGFVLVLTEKYLDSVVYFQWLCLAGVFISLADMNVNFINIKGRSRYALILEIIKLSLALLVLLFTYKRGLIFIVYGQLIVRVACYVFSTLFSRQVYGYGLNMQFKDLIPSFLIAFIAAFICYLPLYYSLLDNKIGIIALQTIIFSVVYLGINHIFRNVIWMEVLHLIRTKIIKVKSV